MPARRLSHEKIEYDFALRRQKRAEPADAGANLRHVGGHEAVEEVRARLRR